MVFLVVLLFSAFYVAAVNATLSTQTALLAERLAELFCGDEVTPREPGSVMVSWSDIFKRLRKYFSVKVAYDFF